MLLFVTLFLLGSCFSFADPANNVSKGDTAEHVCTFADCLDVAEEIIGWMNRSVDPCQDFYKFSCGGFDALFGGEGSINQYGIVGASIQYKLKGLLEQQNHDINETSTARLKIRRYYTSCMDLDAVNNNTLKAMQRMVEQMGGFLLSSDDVANCSLNNVVALYELFYSNGFFAATVDNNPRNVTQQLVVLNQGRLGLGIGTRDYYVNKSISSDRILMAYTQKLVSFAEAIFETKLFNHSFITDVIEFEAKLAEIQMSNAQRQDLTNYMSVSISFLETNYDFFNWTQYFNNMFAPVNFTFYNNDRKDIILRGAAFFRRLTDLLKAYMDIPIGKQILQNYLIFRALIAYAPYVGGPFKKADDAFNSVYLQRIYVKQRWMACLDDIDDDNLGFPLGAIYVENALSQDTKHSVTSIVETLRKSFRQRIEDASWIMENATRQAALEKLDALVFKVAYPDWLMNETYLDDRYSKLVVTDDYVENQFTAYTFSRITMLSKLRKAFDRSDWYMTPQNANAYYDRASNTVVIPAAYVSSPPLFYRGLNVPSSVNYGALGSTIGHEMTHGFDNWGRQYDLIGDLQNWWDNSSSEEFNNRSACFIKKFDAYRINGLNVKGRQTLAENIADDGGLKIAFTAYKLNGKGNKRLVRLQEFTPDQLFFIAYGQKHCYYKTPAGQMMEILTDPHAPSRLRLIGTLSNSNDFTEAFNCSDKKQSFMVSQKKCSIW